MIQRGGNKALGEMEENEEVELRGALLGGWEVGGGGGLLSGCQIGGGGGLVGGWEVGGVRGLLGECQEGGGGVEDLFGDASSALAF